MEIMKKNNCLQADDTPMTDMLTRYFPKMLKKSVLDSLTLHLKKLLININAK